MVSIRAQFREWRGFIATTAVVGAVLLFGAFRGFDFTDEGFYYLSFAHPEEVSDYQTSYHLFGAHLFALTGHSIVLMRLVAAALTALGLITFLAGLRCWQKDDPGSGAAGRNFGAIAACAGAALGLAFATAPLAPSYNLLNATLLYAFTGTALACASVRPDDASGFKRFSALAVLAGLILAADFFVKFSTSVTLAASGVVFGLVAGRVHWRRKLQLIGLVSLVGLLAAGFFFAVLQDFEKWRAGSEGLWRSIVSGPVLSSFFARYGRELTDELLNTLWAYEPAFTLAWIGGTALWIARRWPRYLQPLAVVVGIAIAGCFLALSLAHNVYAKVSSDRIQFHLAALLLSLLLAVLSHVLHRNSGHSTGLSGRGLLLTAWMVALPIFGSVGTNNELATNLFYQIAPWSVATLLLLNAVDRLWGMRWATRSGAAFLLAVSLAQFWRGYIIEPYRIPGSLLTQTEPTSIGVPGSTLRLGSASRALVEGARAQLTANGFKPGGDIFAFFNLPGLVFAVGGVSPGHPWYFGGSPGAFERDAMRVGLVPLARREAAFVITNGNLQTFPELLKRVGLDFPSGYTPCGEPIRNPLTGETVEIWRPNRRTKPPSATGF